MGWTALIALEPLIAALTWNGFSWMLAGGLIYTAGIVFIYDGVSSIGTASALLRAGRQRRALRHYPKFVA